MKTYLNPWLFKNEIVEFENYKGYEGFVYIITDIKNNKKYLGRKYFTSKRKPAGKKRRVTKESDWQNYYGSSKLLQEEVKTHGIENFKREILAFGKTRGDVNFLETKYLFYFNVLDSGRWYNENILGKYHKKNAHIEEARIVDMSLLNRATLDS